MPTIEPRLGLAKPLLTDDFDTAEMADNLQKIANHPGAYVCTSITRPGGWTGSNVGQFIIETDTELLWRWNGSAFERHGAKGHLETNRRTSDLAGSTTYATIASCDVTVPEGGRAIRLMASWRKVGAPCFMRLRGAGVTLFEWDIIAGVGGSMPYVDQAPPAGARTYTFQFRTVSGATNLTAAVDSPASLDVEEI